MGARARRTILAIAVVSRKGNGKIRFPRRQERRKEIQSRRAVLRAVEQEIGLAREDVREMRHQEAETSL